MGRTDDHTKAQEAVGLMTRALALLDEMGDHVAAAQLDHVVRLVQDRSDSDRGR